MFGPIAKWATQIDDGIRRSRPCPVIYGPGFRVALGPARSGRYRTARDIVTAFVEVADARALCPRPKLLSFRQHNGRR